MNAVNYDVKKRINGRTLLKNVLPLKSPFSCNIFVANSCNFKCFYCVNADLEKKKQMGIRNDMLSYEDFVTIADHLDGAEQLKSIIFAGVGEPLLNKEITRMIQYCKKKQIAEKIEIITNGAFPTRALCEDIVESGLDRIRISLNGLSAEDYKVNCATDLDYEEFKDNLKYLYDYRMKHHKNMAIYIKIMDVMVENELRKAQFYNEYGSICDDIYVESLVPINNMEYDENPDRYKNTLFGENTSDIPCKVCPQPFYSFSIGSKGEFYPCCQIPMPKSLGNLLEKNLSDLWNSREHLLFLISILEGEFKRLPVCDKCKKYEYLTLEADILDGYEEKLIKKYRKML